MRLALTHAPAFEDTPAATADYVSLIEAAYDLRSDDAAWLARLLRFVSPFLGSGMGVFGYSFEFLDASVVAAKIDHLTFAGCPDTMLTALISASEAAAPEERGAMMAGPPCKSMSQTLRGMPSAKASVAAFRRHSGAGDMLTVLAAESQTEGCVLAAAVDRPMRFPAQAGRVLERVARHMAAARRLRSAYRRAGTASLFIDGAEAVIAETGAIVHADGEAATSAVRRLILDAVDARAQSRTSLRRADPSQAVDTWRAMISGKWTLVDAVDTDGKRFLLLRRNTPAPDERAALTHAEQHVASLAARGHTTKLIAYELGVSAATVSTQLTRALRKLRIGSRADLVRLYSPRGAARDAG